MGKCHFCKQEFNNEVENYCCYWCEIHGKMQRRILIKLQETADEAKDFDLPEYEGLHDAIEIVKREFAKLIK